MIAPDMRCTELAAALAPTDADVLAPHLNLRVGDLPPRIITVGDHARAILAATLLEDGDAVDPADHLRFLDYSRGSLTITTSPSRITTVCGLYRGVRVAVVAIGMGLPMMDLLVREARAIVRGEMLIIRLGSCAGLGDRALMGSVVVAAESRLCYRNPDFFVCQAEPHRKPTREQHGRCAFPPPSAASAADPDLRCLETSPYILSKPAKPDKALQDLLHLKLRTRVSEFPIDSDNGNGCNGGGLSLGFSTTVNVVLGSDLTADSYYAIHPDPAGNFTDHNAGVMPAIKARYDAAAECSSGMALESVQMETFQLLHLASVVRNQTPAVRAAACTMVVENNDSDQVCTLAHLKLLELACCTAVLDTAVSFDLPSDLGN